MKKGHKGHKGHKGLKTLMALMALMVCAGGARGLDFAATHESAWITYVGTPAPARISDARLRDAMQWRILGRPLPTRLGATPYGIALARWERTIANFGLPTVAAEYSQFLTQLRAELDREKQNQAQ